MIFENMDRIVFFVFSITDFGRARPIGEGLGDNAGTGYVKEIENLLATCYPGTFIRVTNMGISGNTSRDLLARFKEDVTDLQPDWVSICIGVNDVWRQFDSPAITDAQVMPEEYEQNVENMILQVKGKVKGIFILSPYYIEPNRDDRMRARMDEHGGISRKLAKKHGCTFVDFQELYDNYCKVRHSSYIAWDRVHPNRIGALLMARAFLDKCDFNYYNKETGEL